MQILITFKESSINFSNNRFLKAVKIPSVLHVCSNISIASITGVQKYRVTLKDPDWSNNDLEFSIYRPFAALRIARTKNMISDERNVDL